MPGKKTDRTLCSPGAPQRMKTDEPQSTQRLYQVLLRGLCGETLLSQQAELLEVYCKRITADPSAQPPAGLQPRLAETVRRLASGLTALQAEPAFAEELSRRLWAEVQVPGRGQEQAPSRPAAARARWRRWARPLGVLGGVAVAAALLLFVVLQPHSEKGGVRGLIGRATPGPAGATSGPAAIAPGERPGIPPLPNWLHTGETVASDQGVTLAYLRAMIHEPHFILLFIGVGGPVAADGSPYLPADLQALDPAGRAYPCQVTWLDSTGGASIGALTLTQVDPAAASLRLQATEMRTAEGDILRGSWQLEPMQRFQPGAPLNPDRLSELDGLQCLRVGDITIANHCYAPCDPAAPPTAAPALFVPRTDTGPATLAPTACAVPATATPPPLEGAPATVVPFPTQPPAPPPPTVAPAALPVATVTPVVPVCDFTDWEHGLFGTTLLVVGPQPHAVYVLIERENGQVRRVSEQEFAEARQRAY